MPRRLALLLILLAGCDEPPAPAKPKAAPSVANPAPAPASGKTREILGKRTQDIRDASAEMKTGEAKAAGPRPIAKDPITLAGSAYITAIGQTSINNIKHALDLYQASEGDFPKTYQEFLDKIIKANNIALPTLPYYQEYGYDAANHKLIILEYPDKKAAANR